MLVASLVGRGILRLSGRGKDVTKQSITPEMIGRIIATLTTDPDRDIAGGSVASICVAYTPDRYVPFGFCGDKLQL